MAKPISDGLDANVTNVRPTEVGSALPIRIYKK
jgi:hypothetical protein